MAKKSLQMVLTLLVLGSTLYAAGSAETTSQDASAPESIVLFNIAFNGVSKPYDDVVHDYILNEANIDVTVKGAPWDQYSNVLALMLSSNESLDAFFDFQKWPEYRDKGAIQPITNEMLAEAPNLTKLLYKESYRVSTDPDGVLWGLPLEGWSFVGSALSYRVGWLEKVGVTTPATLSEFESCMAAIRSGDPNGNGKNDEIPLLGLGFGSIVETFQPSFTGEAGDFYLDDNGELQRIEFHPGYKELIAKIAQWYKEGYIYKEIATVTSNDAFTAIIAEDRVMFYAGWFSHSAIGAQKLRTLVPDADYLTIDPIEGPAGTYYAHSDSAMVGHSVTIARKSENPLGVMRFLDFFVSDPQHTATIVNGLEGDGFTWVDKEARIISPISEPALDFSRCFGAFGLAARARIIANSYTTEKYVEISSILNQMLERGKAVVSDTEGFKVDNEAVERVVNTTDLMTFRDERLLGFMNGRTPMSEYEAFLDTWTDMGVDDYCKEITRQYNAQ